MLNICRYCVLLGILYKVVHILTSYKRSNKPGELLSSINQPLLNEHLFHFLRQLERVNMVKASSLLHDYLM